MATFGLVHGGWHGAWCWEALAPVLERGGHTVVTMDLPCHDASASLDTYADVVCAALDGSGDDVVLVGHSLGGHTVPLVAARRPVRHLVYLCAVVPRIGSSVMDQAADQPDMWNLGFVQGLTVDEQDRQVWVDLELARRHLFADCDDATAAAAIERLRPQTNHSMAQTFPLAELPTVGCTYIVCTEDQMINPAWSRRVARDRLGAGVVELPGSHSPFLSRPQALAKVLLDLV